MTVRWAVEVEDFSWRYQQAREFALRDVNLKIPEGSFTLVVGPNESGKTTLMLAIKGLIPHSLPGTLRGTVRVFGQPVEHTSAPVLAKRVGYVFGDPEAQFTALTVEEEILFGLENIGVPEEEIGERIRWASELTMVADLLDKPPYDISGGQKQRVAIASVLAMRPDILILDEPTSMIDPLGKDQVVQICAELKATGSMTIIVVEHNVEAFAHLADQVVLVYRGQVVRVAPPREFFEDLEFLAQHDVSPPQVTTLFALLRERGLYNGALPLTDDEGIAAGWQLLAGEGS
ncbi:Energy-coupling factor transporter ATP-binding protein EcfA2 [bacterium HR26]|nr:Energy-coupling factor transporter ATP-binding protein EcfA2 [bacterium HR26]